MSKEGEVGHDPGQVAGIDLAGSGLGSLVERERLSSRLVALDTPLVLLHAPAGYGKSVLLAQGRGWIGDRSPRSPSARHITIRPSCSPR